MRIVLDTSVIIEYVIANSPWRGLLARLFSSALRGVYELYLSTVTLAEVFYVVKRIYEEVGVEKPGKAAENFLFFLEKHKGLSIISPSFDIAVEAGKIKSLYKISLADSFVFATAKILKAKPMFRKIEKELEPYIEDLKKEYELITIEELSKGVQL